MIHHHRHSGRALPSAFIKCVLKHTSSVRYVLKRSATSVLWLGLLLSPMSQAIAQAFSIPASGNDIIGEIQQAFVEPGDTLDKIAIRYSVGSYQLIEANPTLNPKKLPLWAPVIIPAAYILPKAPRDGIVINLAELRLYYFPPNSGQIITFPIGIGRFGWSTPLGRTKIIEKKENPTWRVPASIRKYVQETKGVTLPTVVPPGPDNPLGKYKMRLALGGAYLIHGTNDPTSIGYRSSSGCIRMLPQDIETLFQMVPIGTAVTVVNQPFKLGWHNEILYMESHQPLQEQEAELQKRNLVADLVQSLSKKQKLDVDWPRADRIAKKQHGYPERIGTKVG